MSAWISKTQGDYNMTVFNAQLDVDAELMVDELGYLQVSKMETDIVFGDLKIYFENLGFLGKMFQVNKFHKFHFMISINKWQVYSYICILCTFTYFERE